MLLPKRGRKRKAATRTALGTGKLVAAWREVAAVVVAMTHAHSASCNCVFQTLKSATTPAVDIQEGRSSEEPLCASNWGRAGSPLGGRSANL